MSTPVENLLAVQLGIPPQLVGRNGEPVLTQLVPVSPLLNGGEGVLWKPGVPSSGNQVATWAEVQAAIAVAHGLVKVYVDSSVAPAIVTPGTTTDLARVTLAAVPGPIGNQTMQVPDTAVLQNLTRIEGALVLELTTTTGPALDYTNDNAVLLLSDGASIVLGAGTTHVPTAHLFGLTFKDRAAFSNAAAPTVPFIALGVGSTLLLTELSNPASSAISGNIVSGPVGSTVEYVADDTGRAPATFTGMLGTITVTMASRAIAESYTDTAPLLGATNVQAAIDALKNRSGGSVVVYRPGGVTAGNVYQTWAALVAAAVLIQGPKTVFVDVTGAPGDGNAHVPAGAWDLGPWVTFQGDPTVAQSTTLGLVFDDGASLVKAPLAFEDLDIVSNATAPVYSDGAAAAHPCFYVRGNATIHATAASFMQVTGAGSDITVTLEDTATLASFAFAAFDASSQVFVNALDLTSVGQDSLSSGVNCHIILEPSANAALAQHGAGTVVISGGPTQHLTSASGGFPGTPAITPEANAGVGATTVVPGGSQASDTSGVVTLTTGVGAGVGGQVQVLFAIPFDKTPNVVMSRGDGNPGQFFVTSVSLLGFGISASVSPSDTTAYVFSWIAIP